MSKTIKLDKDILEGVDAVELEDAEHEGQFIQFTLPAPEPENAKRIIFINDDDSLYATSSVSSGDSVSAPVSPTKTGYSFVGWNTTKGDRSTQLSFPATITADIDAYAEFIQNINLESATWAQVKEISDSGAAAAMWSVGDTKSITFPAGTQIGDGLTFAEDTTLYAFILGFDHNIAVEASGYSHSITFGTFKTAATDGIDVSLTDSNYSVQLPDGNWFDMNSTNSNAGGWKACKMRCTLLGSTDVDNGDATPAATSNPAANTFMAALPAELRAVMKPMIKWTDNVGGSVAAANVTTSIDYLPLLSETEVIGGQAFSNEAEFKHQRIYAYYGQGNARIKYKHNKTDTIIKWWLRSRGVEDGMTSDDGFCRLTEYGTSRDYYAHKSQGCSPLFTV